MDRNRFLQIFLAVIAGVVIAPYFNPGSMPTAHAQEAGMGAMFAVTAPGTNGNGHNVLFVIDSMNQKLAVYEHRTGGFGGGKLSLVAVRNMQFDLEYPLQFPPDKARVHEPAVKEVQKQIEKLNRPK